MLFVLSCGRSYLPLDYATVPEWGAPERERMSAEKKEKVDRERTTPALVRVFPKVRCVQRNPGRVVEFRSMRLSLSLLIEGAGGCTARG